MPNRDYYTILGVGKNATEDEIKSAFRKLAPEFHPDTTRMDNKGVAEEKFKELNEAWSVLKDADKRVKYDETVREGRGQTGESANQSRSRGAGVVWGQESATGNSQGHQSREGDAFSSFFGVDLNNFFTGMDGIFGTNQTTPKRPQRNNTPSQPRPSPSPKSKWTGYDDIKKESKDEATIKLSVAEMGLASMWYQARVSREPVTMESGFYRVSLDDQRNIKVEVKGNRFRMYGEGVNMTNQWMDVRDLSPGNVPEGVDVPLKYQELIKNIGTFAHLTAEGTRIDPRSIEGFNNISMRCFSNEAQQHTAESFTTYLKIEGHKRASSVRMSAEGNRSQPSRRV